MAWAVRVYHALENGEYEKEPLTGEVFKNRENAEHYANELRCEQTGNKFMFEVEEVTSRWEDQP